MKHHVVITRNPLEPAHEFPYPKAAKALPGVGLLMSEVVKIHPPKEPVYPSYPDSDDSPYHTGKARAADCTYLPPSAISLCVAGVVSFVVA